MNDWLTEWMNEWMNKWMHACMHGWMDGWMNEWMNEWMEHEHEHAHEHEHEHEMTWNEMHLEWNEMNWNGVKWNELEWSEMKWIGMEWNEMNWNEMNEWMKQMIETNERTNKRMYEWMDFRCPRVKQSSKPSIDFGFCYGLKGGHCPTSSTKNTQNESTTEEIHRNLLILSWSYLSWVVLTDFFCEFRPRAGIQQCRNRSILCQSLGFHFLLRCPKLFEHLLTAGSFKGFPSHSVVCPWICCVLRKIKHFMKDGSAPGTRWIFHSKKLFYYINQSLSNLLVFAEDTHDELCFKLWSNAVFFVHPSTLCNILHTCVRMYVYVICLFT